METKYLFLVAIAVLYGLGALLFKGTHPYAGSQRETFDSKQQRRRIGTVLVVSATLLAGVAVLTQFLISRDH
jgi:hypothetical protein